MKYPVRYLLCSITIGATLFSCQVNEPVKPNLILTSEDIPQLVLTQTNYDSVQVSLAQPIQLPEQLVTTIYVDIVTTTGQQILSDTLQPDYKKAADVWEVNFSKTYGFADSVTAINVNMQIHQRYNEAITRSASIQCLKYPYPSAKIMLSFRDIQDIGSYGVQDLALWNQRVYLLGFGADGAWEYNRESQAVNYLFVTGFGGDYITANDTALFCDYADFDVVRFSFKKNRFYFNHNLADSIKLHTNGNMINGLTKSDSLLIVLVNGNPPTIYWINTDLELVRWQQIDPTFTAQSGIAYADSILYAAHSFLEPRISRYSLAEKRMLPDLVVPSRAMYGIDIISEWLYFVDNTKMIVGAVSLAALKTLPQ